MEQKRRKLSRYIKRGVCVTIGGVLGYLAAYLVCAFLNLFDPGWLIVALMYVLKVTVPLVGAFIALAVQFYKEAIEDGELDEIMSKTSPIFDIVKNGMAAATPSEDTLVAESEPTNDVVECSNSEMCEVSAPSLYLTESNSENNSDCSKIEDDLEMEQHSLPNQSQQILEPLPPKASGDTLFQHDSGPQNTTSEEHIPADPLDWIREPEIMGHYIVLDIETTGFSPTNDRIIEIAAVHYVFGSEASRFHTFVNPNRPIPRRITDLTGICQSDVESAPEIDDITDDFSLFIKDYPLVGHNIIDFDLPFLAEQFDISIPNVVIDTLPISKMVFPDFPTHKLSDLKDWLRLHDGESHRAGDDVAATNALLWACLYPEKYNSLYHRAVIKGTKEPNKPAKMQQHPKDKRVRVSEITATTDCIDCTGPLYGKKIVFTGELSIPRKQAMQLAVDAGAVLRSSVSGKTDYLVVGTQDLNIVGADRMSTKQEKAQSLNESGLAHINIIGEKEFCELVEKVLTQ